MFEKIVTITWNADLTKEERCQVVAEVFDLDTIYRSGRSTAHWLTVRGERVAPLPLTITKMEAEEFLALLVKHNAMPNVAEVETVLSSNAPTLRSPGIMWLFDEAEFEARKLVVTANEPDDDFIDFDARMKSAVAAIRAKLRQKVADGNLYEALIKSDCRKIEIIRDERVCDASMMVE